MSDTPMKDQPSEEPNKGAEPPKKKKNFLVIYVATLLALAMVLLLFSFLQNRRADEQLSNLQDQHNIFQTSALQSIDDLNARLDQLTKENSALQAENSKLNAANEKLTDLNTDLRAELTNVKNQLSETRLELEDAEQRAKVYLEMLELAEEYGAISLSRDEDGTVNNIGIEE